MIAKLADEEGLNIINNGDSTHVSFATRTETAIDVTMVTPELNREVKCHENHLQIYRIEPTGHKKTRMEIEHRGLRELPQYPG
jgi:hypothetical protein